MSNVELVHSFAGDKPVDAVTTLHDELYVRYKGQPDIAVYDKGTFSLQRRLSVEGLGNANDMASCKRYRCVYIADDISNFIHRVEKSNDQQTKWSVDDEPYGLSVNSDCNVVVTFGKVRKVNVFTSHGELVKELNLQQTDIVCPRHTIQLSIHKYVVSNGTNGTTNRVVIIDGSGRIEQSFGEDKGSKDDQLDQPRRLAVVKNDNILIADTDNKRLVMLTSRLQYVKSWKLIGSPYRMWIDEESGRLFVGVNEWNVESKTYTTGHVEVYSVD